MGLVTSMYSGVSGISANSHNLEVISNNIANVNTMGYKSQNAVFSDVLSTVLHNGSSAMQFGHGTQISAINSSFQQGSFESTTNATDLAVDGNGFFVVNNGAGNIYTRSGQFKLSNQGRLVNPQGYNLQGYAITNGKVGATVGNIDLTGVQSKPQASTSFTTGVNLNAAATATTTFTTPVTLYNSVGEQVILNISFTKIAGANSWSFAPTTSVGTVTVNNATSGTISFDTSGGLSSLTIGGTNLIGTAAPEPVFRFTFPGTASSPPAANQTVVWDLLTTVATVTNGAVTWDSGAATAATNGKATGYASGSNNSSLVQNGFTTGVLTGLSVDSSGIITGLFDNGQTEQLNQVVLAQFLNPGGMTKLGANLFSASAESGEATLGGARTGGFGTIIGDTLELSNVDLASEFVKMITTQQAYQAAAKTITTSNELMTEAINLKR